MLEELKPCPFCRGVPTLFKMPWWWITDSAFVQVYCSDCKSTGPKHVYDGVSDYETAAQYAIEEWNQRV